MLNLLKIKDVICAEIKGIWGDEPTPGAITTPVIKTNNMTYEGYISYDNLTYRVIPENKLGYSYLLKGDILIEKSGGTRTHSVGYVNIFESTDNKYVCNNFVIAIRPDKNKIIPKYLFYQMKHFYETGIFSDCYNKTTGIQNLKVSTYLDKKITCPDFTTQNQNISFLDKVVGCISVKKEQLKQLDELVKSRFIEMFGNLGEDIFGNGITTLGECTFINPKKKQKIDDNVMISFVPMPEVTENGDINGSIIRPYKEVKKGYTYFENGDVLFAKITPCMENGKGCVVRGMSNNIGIGSTEFHVIRPKPGITTAYWIYTLTMLSGFRILAKSNMTGAGGQRRVPISFLENFPVAVPPIELQNTFAEFVKQVDKSKFIVQKQIEDLQELLDSKMDEYFG